MQDSGIILIVIIIVAGDVVKKALYSYQVNASEKSTEKEIEKMKLPTASGGVSSGIAP